MAWTVILLDEVDEWLMVLVHDHPRSAELVTAAIDQLEADGPNLGRPLVDRDRGLEDPQPQETASRLCGHD